MPAVITCCIGSVDLVLANVVVEDCQEAPFSNRNQARLAHFFRQGWSLLPVGTSCSKKVAHSIGLTKNWILNVSGLTSSDQIDADVLQSHGCLIEPLSRKWIQNICLPGLLVLAEHKAFPFQVLSGLPPAAHNYLGNSFCRCEEDRASMVRVGDRGAEGTVGKMRAGCGRSLRKFALLKFAM